MKTCGLLVRYWSAPVAAVFTIWDVVAWDAIKVVHCRLKFLLDLPKSRKKQDGLVVGVVRGVFSGSRGCAAIVY